MRVVFRVEGEPNIGLGHVMRCLALAQSLTSCSHQVFFIMSASSQQFCQNRKDWVGEIIPFNSADRVDIIEHDHEANWVKQKCMDLSADWLVLDGYQFDQHYRQDLVCDDFQFAVFDDMNNSGNLHADLVINGAVTNGTVINETDSSAQLNYAATAPQAQLAVGKAYQVLRQEFLQIPDKSWTNRDSLTLMFGGSDPHNMTLLILQAFAKQQASMPISASLICEPPIPAHIVVITGAAYSRLDELEEFLAHCDLAITHYHDCQTMADVLVHSRLALSAAGGSQFELLACATPTILLVVADNQKFASQQAATQGWCQVSSIDDSTAEELAQACLNLWQQDGLLRAMHQQALQQPVIDGAKAIVELMLNVNHSGEKS